MRFLIDAQLPRRLAYRLREARHDAVHTLDLPNGNRTTDTEINRISEQEKRVVITKDADFVNSFIIAGKPHKLLLVSTGNIINEELEALVDLRISTIVAAFQTHDFVELNRSALFVHA